MDRETKETLAHASKALENVTDIFNKLARPVRWRSGSCVRGQSTWVPNHDFRSPDRSQM